MSAINLLDVAFVKNDKITFEALLNQNADFTLKNENGLTIIHQIIRYTFDHLKTTSEFTRNFQNYFVDSILCAHVKFGNSMNPCDRNGISHFHAACMSNNAKAVTFFIKNGVSITDQSVKKDSDILPGYSPLHLAVKYCSLDVAKVLLEHGEVNTYAKNLEGMTPLQMLIKQKMEIVIHKSKNGEFLKQMSLYDRLIDLLLRNTKTMCNNKLVINCNTGLSNFHIVCTMFPLSTFKIHPMVRILLHSMILDGIDINHSVKINSPVCPGFTALQFAAHCNFETFKLLLTFKNINRESLCFNGVSYFDMNIGATYEHMYNILKESWLHIVLSNGITTLDDVISSIRVVNSMDVNLSICNDSPLWPGHTILHLAVILLRNGDETHAEKFVQNLLEQGADVTAVNSRNQTPLHLAYRMQENKFVELMLRYHHQPINPVDQDGLSHLHIACAVGDESLIKNILNAGTNVNSVYFGKSFSLIHEKSTPLHVAVYYGNIRAVRLLVMHGAELHAKDINNVTPLHWALDKSATKSMCKVLLEKCKLNENIEANNGLTLLQIACAANIVPAVEQLLKSEACVNEVYRYEKPICQENSYINHFDAKIRDIFAQYIDFTPLHFAADRNCKEVIDLLIRRGANLYIKNTKYFNTWGYERYIECMKMIVSSMGHSCILEHFKNLNLSLLHVACYKMDISLIKTLLNEDVDVNVQIFSKSPLWPGFTPLHVLMQGCRQKNKDEVQKNIKVILQLLLDKGADITIRNAQQESPLHMAYKEYYQDYMSLFLILMMLNSHKDFNLNPVNGDVISHFYIACALSDVNIVKKFLKSGLNVNEEANIFTNDYFTPLLITVNNLPKVHHGSSLKIWQIIDLLIEYDADTNVKTYHGNTLLHIVAEKNSSFCRENLIERLINCGLDINDKNVYGTTAAEIMLRNDVSGREFGLLLKNMNSLNIFNPISKEGLLAMIFSNRTCSMLIRDVISGEIRENTSSFIGTDNLGRTIIHNVVSLSRAYDDIGDDEFVDFIERLEDAAHCDIDDQDDTGRTALHFAVKFKNEQAVSVLLKADAEPDIVDKNGETALHVAVMSGNEKIVVKLLNSGADINVRDSKNKLALDYNSTSSDFSSMTEVLVKHLKKLKLSGLVSQKFKYLSKYQKYVTDTHSYDYQLFNEQLEATKYMKIEPYSFSVCNYFSKIEVMENHPYRWRNHCHAINEFFKINQDQSFEENFFEIISLLRLLHRKVLKILEFIEQSRASLRIIAGFPLPDPCSDVILKYLDKLSMTNLITSMEEL